MSEFEATQSQLDTAAKLSVSSNMPFSSALKLILEQPELESRFALNSKPIYPNAVEQVATPNMSAKDFLSLLDRIYQRGSQDAEQNKRLETMQAELEVLRGQVTEQGQLARIAGVGIIDHIEDHALNDNETSALSPLQTLNFMMEALPVGMKKGFVQNLPADLRSLLENQEKAKALPTGEEFDAPEDDDDSDEETPPVPPKRRSFFARG